MPPQTDSSPRRRGPYSARRDPRTCRRRRSSLPSLHPHTPTLPYLHAPPQPHVRQPSAGLARRLAPPARPCSARARPAVPTARRGHRRPPPRRSPLPIPSTTSSPSLLDSRAGDAKTSPPTPPSSPSIPSPPSYRRSLRDLARLARLFRSEWPALGRAGALSLVAATLGLAAPLLTAALFDRVYPAGNASLLALLVLALLAAKASEGAVRALYHFAAFTARVRMRDLARLALFNHVLHLPARTLERRRSGEIANRFGDVREVLDSGADAVLAALSQGAFLLAVPPILVLLDARLAAVALVAVPLTAGITAALGHTANRHWTRTYAAYDEWSAFRTEALREARTFKSMACEGALYRRARRYVADAHAGTVRATGLWYLCTGTNAVVRAANLAALTYLGWRSVLAGDITLGAYVAFQLYAGLLLAPLATLIDAGAKLQRAAVSLARVFDLADEPPESDPSTTLNDESSRTETLPPLSPSVRGSTAQGLVPEPGGGPKGTYRPQAGEGVPPARYTGRIRARGLSFRYGPDAPGLTLDRLDLEGGEVVALVGPSGCGKSTLLRLLARIERPDAGELSAEVESSPGSHALSRSSWRPLTDDPRWRARIATCWQRPGLLSSPVRDNLLLTAEPVASRPIADDELRAVLDACALTPRLAELARQSAARGGSESVCSGHRCGDGLDVPLSEGAATLSAGERQRLALARTLLRVRVAHTPIRLVLLDEVASSLDAATAGAVLSAVLGELRRPTATGAPPPAVVLVSHRPEHTALADRTVRLAARPAPAGTGSSTSSGDGLPGPAPTIVA